MCIGPEILPILGSVALGVGGSLYNANQQREQQNKASAATSRAAIDNLRRQEAQAQRSRELFVQAVPTQERPRQEQDLDAAAATRLATMEANLGPEKADYAPTPASAPRVVGQAQRNAEAAGRRKVDAEAAALARLGGWGDAQQGNRIGLNRFGGQIRENNSFVQGIANLLPQEQNAAATKVYSKPLAPWGDIAQAAGQAGTMYFWPQAAYPTFADVLGLQRKSPVNGLGEVRG